MMMVVVVIVVIVPHMATSSRVRCEVCGIGQVFSVLVQITTGWAGFVTVAVNICWRILVHPVHGISNQRDPSGLDHEKELCILREADGVEARICGIRWQTQRDPREVEFVDGSVRFSTDFDSNSSISFE